MHKFRVALFIGRFQPFHNGHLYSLDKCFELADKVVIGIGSSQESGTENNPWDYEMRREMIESLAGDSLPAQAGQKVEVVPIPDLFDDKKWGDQIISLIKTYGLVSSEVVGVGNNEWTNRIFRAIGVDVYETGLYKRDELEGIRIRELMKMGDDSWKARVPNHVVKWLEKYELPK